MLKQRTCRALKTTDGFATIYGSETDRVKQYLERINKENSFNNPQCYAAETQEREQTNNTIIIRAK